MKKTIIYILLISLVLFGGQCAQKQKAAEGPFVGGAKGVDIAFIAGSPPTEFSQTDTVPVKVLLKNNGEQDINAEDAQVKVYGIYYPNFGLLDQYKGTSSILRGITQFEKEGGEQQVEIGNLKYTQPVTNFEDITLRAKVCYPYETKSQIKACLGSLEIKEKGGEQICELTGEKVKSGSVSAAPIQVTSVNQKPYAANQILFEITIQNSGKGDVYDPSFGCIDFEDLVKRSDAENIVNVEVNPADVKCSFLESESNKGQIRLTTGKKILSCRKTVEATESNFEQNLNINLNYKYIDRASTNIKIREFTS